MTMAINSNELGDKTPIRSLCSSKTSTMGSCRLIQINFAGKDSCSGSRAYRPKYNRDIKSPYFTNDKVHLLSRVTAKKCVNKKATENISSFPLATSLYKANSDEFKLKRRVSKKVKKSVLTLPNEPVPMPKTYTLCNLNDSEYINVGNNPRANNSKKRRTTVRRNKNFRLKEHAMKYCDRDARYCSQLNIDLDCSSSEIVNFNGDGEKISKLSYNSNTSVTGDYPHDMWTVLRDINKFQFRSPPNSQKNLVTVRKRRPITKKSNDSNDTHFIETCHTEEFAYISNFDVDDSKSHESCSLSSSFDRITVIDKQSERDEIIQQLSRNIFGSNVHFEENVQNNVNNRIKGTNKLLLRNNNKGVTNVKKKIEKNEFVPSIMRTQSKTLELDDKNVAVEFSNNRFSSNLEKTLKTCDIRKPLENGYCLDNANIKENDSITTVQTNSFGKGFRSGDVYKSNNMKPLTKNSTIKVNLMKPIGDSVKHLNGITKVILSKGQEVLSPNLTENLRKPRLALTLPNTNVSKLSRFEIKRRLANQKFPIVILGKDQLTNRGIFVANVDPPQFDGLDQHIWPFMLGWFEEKYSEDINVSPKKEFIKTKNHKLRHKVNSHYYVTTVTPELPNCNISWKKPDECKKKKQTLSTTNNKLPLGTEVPLNDHKPKSLFHLKNKMYQFLQKNPTSAKIIESLWDNNGRSETGKKDKAVGDSPTMDNEWNFKGTTNNVHIKEITEKASENKIVAKSYSPLRYPWAKGKSANDFIENIIKKICTGEYYSVDRRDIKYRIIGTEVSTQTEINSSKNAYCQNSVDMDSTLKLGNEKDDPLKNILEFDETLTTLEIETISTNKIAVKNCIKNVVVQFDIQVVAEPKKLSHSKKSMSCIPVSVKDNQEKVFKCNTSIINAILPAELCTIIPTMMRTILDAENKLFLQSVPAEVFAPNLTAVLDLTRTESPPLIMHSIASERGISNELRLIFDGRFPNNPYLQYKHIKRTDLIRPTKSLDSIDTLFTNFNAQMIISQPSFNIHISVDTLSSSTEKYNQMTNRISNCCKALQPYNPKQFSVVPFSGFFSVAEFIKQIVHRIVVNNFKKIIITCNYGTWYNNKASRPILLSRKENQQSLDHPFIGNVGVLSLYNAFNRNDQNPNDDNVHISNIIATNDKKEKPLVTSTNVNSKTSEQKKAKPIKILRRKSYIRCYRKCNSMSSISCYKCTPLNKVTSLEDFCQVLGSNLFYSVLDGCLEKKLLVAVEEMKNWITDISRKQALLILLLLNKKDTPNLIRFKPVLLQGIAVNRITKASELDTEIEVIEKENLCKLSQYEGISYLPASTKNQDSLLEELYWIAKTTASDYQKTFDESSEKLLKSLLQKRKKLNPSYLRVMARYVGLGLLTPTKS